MLSAVIQNNRPTATSPEVNPTNVDDGFKSSSGVALGNNLLTRYELKVWTVTHKTEYISHNLHYQSATRSPWHPVTIAIMLIIVHPKVLNWYA